MENIPQLLSSQRPSMIQPQNRDHFPHQLHRMLCEIDQAPAHDELRHIISWDRDGTSFTIHQPTKFCETILGRYFEKQTRYKSFQRQLNLYKFKREKPGQCKS